METRLSHRDDKDKGSWTALPTSSTAVEALSHAYSEIKSEGGNPLKSLYVVDIATSLHFGPKFCKDFMPCITRSRGGQRSFWLSSLRRRIKVNELLRLQGIPDSMRRVGVSDSQVGMMVENTMRAAYGSRATSMFGGACQWRPIGCLSDSVSKLE